MKLCWMKVYYTTQFWFAISVVLVGCYNFPSSYTLNLDSNFSTEERVQIQTAVAMWEDAVPVHIDIAEGVYGCEEYSDNICMHKKDVVVPCDNPNDVYYGCTNQKWCDKDWKHSVISVLPLEAIGDGEAFKIVVAHELGHALGLMHTGSGTLMAASYSDDAHIITCTDVMQYDKLHGTKTTCLLLP